MNNIEYVIHFDGEDLATSNIYASELRIHLLECMSDKGVDLSVELQKKDDSTMDFGATLAVISASPVALVLANALRDWLKKRNTSSITIENADGKTIVKNISAKDAVNLVDRLNIS